MTENLQAWICLSTLSIPEFSTRLSLKGIPPSKQQKPYSFALRHGVVEIRDGDTTWMVLSEAMLAASRAEVCALSFLSTCLMASATASQRALVEAFFSIIILHSR